MGEIEILGIIDGKVQSKTNVNGAIQTVTGRRYQRKMEIVLLNHKMELLLKIRTNSRVIEKTGETNGKSNPNLPGNRLVKIEQAAKIAVIQIMEN